MTGPDPAVARARSAVRAVLEDDAVVPPGGLVLVACSGGPDSLALAAATAFVAPRTGRRAGAVVVDHGLQPGSGDVARDAARTCRALGLDPVDVVAVDASSGTGGPEARARTARHAALDAAATRHGAAVVLLGHTLDDQAEGVLLGLARGSGARSLGGMPARRGHVVRPFLGLRRADTRRVCEVLDLRPWHDPTNDDGDGPLRSRVRTRVLPVLEETLGPGVAEALARTAGQLRADADVLDGLAAHLLAEARLPDGTDDGAVVGLDVARLAQASEAVRRRALRQAVTGAGAPGGAVGEVHVRAVDALVTGWRGQGPVHLPGGVRAERRCGRLALHEPTDDREH